MKRIVIIGNGFDLDAGLNTRYKDFAASEYWPFKNEKKRLLDIESLAYTLNKQSQLQTWFDVEETMFQYAQKGKIFVTDDGLLPYDRQSFRILIQQLELFLKHEEESFIPREDSVAATLLRSISMNASEYNIYSFNYTNLNMVAKVFGAYRPFKCDYIHGSLANHDIVLGVGDRHELRSNYDFLYKTMSPHFRSHMIIPDMQESDEVFFFGHSLGYNDYAYFQPFFNSQVRYGNYTRKKITIFTYNQDSAFEIKRNLRNLTGNDLNLLYSLNDFQIVCTDGSMSDEVDNIKARMMC